MLNDFKVAFRTLAKSPGFTVVAVLTLALGIGISTTIFNGANPLLFRPLPFRDPDALVYLNETNLKQGFRQMSVAYADYVHWRKENQTLADVGVWSGANFALGGDDRPERIEGGLISATLFSILGVRPALGRDFLATEDQPGAEPVALLSERLWQRRFGGDPKIVGQTILLNGRAHIVVGVMPPRFLFPNNVELWTPLIVDTPEKTHGIHSNQALGRRKPGVTLQQVEADFSAIQQRIAEETPRTNTNVTALVRPMNEVWIEDNLRTMGWTMLAAVGFVLAVACTNVASLFLTRALGRQREFVVRAALGAGRWRIVRQLLVESLLLGTAAGTLGFLFSLWGIDLVLRLVPVDIPYWIDFSVDGRVLAFAIGVSLLTSVLFGLVPAWQAARVNVQSGLAEAARGSSGGRGRQRLRSLLVISEVALALMLLCGTGLMIRSFVNLRNADPGFNPRGLAAFYVNLTSGTAAERTALIDTLCERVGALPGVRNVAACSSPPMAGRNNGQGYAIEGRPPLAPGETLVGNFRAVTSGYFAAMQIPLLAGRDFTHADSATAPPVVIIDAVLARQFFANENPIGKRLRWSLADPATAMEIVGVAGNVKHYGLEQDIRPGFYVPFAQNQRRTMAILFRTGAGDPLAVMPEARRIVHDLDPTLPLFNVDLMSGVVERTYWVSRFLGKLFVGFAVLGLGLAAVGIASVVAYAVTQRRREIGVRMALGAQAGDVLRLLLGQGMRLVFVGLALGLIASLGLARVLTSQLYGVGWFDPLTLLASAALFIAVAFAACWLPARRATRVNPVEALRAE